MSRTWSKISQMFLMGPNEPKTQNRLKYELEVKFAEIPNFSSLHFFAQNDFPVRIELIDPVPLAQFKSTPTFTSKSKISNSAENSRRKFSIPSFFPVYFNVTF